MNKNTSATKKGQSLRILSYFCIAVVLLIGISLSIKVVVTLSKSSYDGAHRFTVVFLQKKPYVVSFSPNTSKITILPVSTNKITKTHISNMLHIPIDASILDKNHEITNTDIAGQMQHVFFSLSHVDTTVTFVDAFRLWMLSRSVGEQDKMTDSLPTSLENADSAIIDKTVSSLFSDTSLTEENKSIQIINATGVSGMGNMLAEIISNSGGNVVSVISGHTDEKKTRIEYTGEASYTVSKLENILQAKAAVLPKKEIFDIIIVLGKDRVRLLEE